MTIGRLGRLTLEPGCYLYVGSAFGPGGLRARLGRHLQGGRALRWHIDYLRAATRPLGAWLTGDPDRREHLWARVLAALPGARVPTPGFGASDCRCPTHLFHFALPPELAALEAGVRKAAPAHGAITEVGARPGRTV